MNKTALLTMLVLAGCAKGPDAIAPLSMPTNAYSGLSCAQLDTERQKSQTELTALEGQQRQAQTGDALGVFLIGVPVSSLGGGDKEGLIAQRKGEVIAIDSMRRNKGC